MYGTSDSLFTYIIIAQYIYDGEDLCLPYNTSVHVCTVVCSIVMYGTSDSLIIYMLSE